MEIINRKAKFEYEILDKFEAGIVLTGTEIKSIRNGNANIKDSYAIIKNGEVFLLICLYQNIKKEIYLIMKKLELENFCFIKMK